MAFNALVNLGTVGEDITGNTVSISGCTGTSCGSGCTSLATGQAVSGFPKTITGIPDNVVSLFVKVDNGQCSGTTQCISINFVAGATATPTATPGPTSTATPTPTPTSTLGPTATPTATPTSTPTATPTPTPTPTPTATVVTYGCGDTVSDTYAPSTFTTQTKYLDLSEATGGDIVTISFAANDRPNRFNIYGNGLLIENSGWVGADNTYAGPWGMPGSLVGSGSGSFTFEYQAGMSYELRVDVGPANPDASPTPNPSDSWSVTIGCTSLSPIGFTITSSCVGYAPTGGTITISGATGGTGSGYTVQMIGGPEGYDNTTHNVPYTYTGLTNEVGNTYNFSVCDGSSNCGSQALTTAISCSSAPNNTVSANLVIQSTQPTSGQCSSGTPYTFDLGSPTATFCTATTFTASGLTGLGTGNNYWLCSGGQTVQVFHPSNAGYFSKAGNCQTVV